MTGTDRSPPAAHPHLQASGIGSQTGFMLRAAQAAVWADLTAALAPFGLRPAHYAALSIVRASPGCRQQEIGDALGMQRPNLVTLVEGLRSRGLLRAARNPADRRSYALRLTADGTRLLAAADRAHDAHRARLATALAPLDEAVLGAALRRLTALAPD